MSEAFPTEIIVDTKKETKSVVVSPEIEAVMPHVTEAFAKVDQAFLENPRAYFERLQDSVFSFKSRTGKEVACSLLYDNDSKKDELLVIFAPFSDGPPKSSARQISSYTAEGPPASFLISMGRKEVAKPNTWNQTTKSAVLFDLLGAIGSGMPVLTIYSPIPSRAYTRQERSEFKSGDFTAASGIASEAIVHAQERLHGLHSETKIDKANLQGGSLGASNAIGAAGGLMDKVIAVQTVTVQELIMGPESFADVAKRFTIAGRVGEPSDIWVPQTVSRIPEPQIRQRIDAHGSELSMLVRMAKAVKPTYLRGLAHPEQTVESIENLLDNNVSLLIALAKNSGLTHQTRDYLPNGGEKVVTVRGEKDQYADHLIDEHVALTALVAALGIIKQPRK